MKFLLLTLMLCASVWAKPFHIFTGYSTSGMPRVDKRLHTATAWYWFHYDSATKKYDLTKIKESQVRRTGREWDTGKILVVDIEEFGNDDYGNGQLARTIDILREENPAIRLGIYAEFPKQNFWGRVPHLVNQESIRQGKEPSTYFTMKDRYEKTWAADEKRLHLAEKVDIVFPACYTIYRTTSIADVSKDPEVHRWELYCEDQIKAARMAKKDVYVYLWPLYHNVGTYTDNVKRYVEPHYWRKQLELAYRLADGIVIWEGGMTAASRNEPWWKETEAFLNEKGLYPVAP